MSKFNCIYKAGSESRTRQLCCQQTSKIKKSAKNCPGQPQPLSNQMSPPPLSRIWSTVNMWTIKKIDSGQSIRKEKDWNLLKFQQNPFVCSCFCFLSGRREGFEWELRLRFGSGVLNCPCQLLCPSQFLLWTEVLLLLPWPSPSQAFY